MTPKKITKDLLESDESVLESSAKIIQLPFASDAEKPSCGNCGTGDLKLTECKECISQ